MGTDARDRTGKSSPSIWFFDPSESGITAESEQRKSWREEANAVPESMRLKPAPVEVVGLIC